ncbi:helix-turn-helix domain-containing protein [Oscillibacter valericigenes]|uniref:helix-turn-helix domain-containing protein n=1 Tax=Oscillibacter valericigenes TaxID=351091 RepID=UPI001F3EA2E3|nr:helix-turn-helix domain-containing protein [Oscillibacter valericigenes]
MNEKQTRMNYFNVEDIPLVLRVEDLSRALGIGRNTAYELVRSGQIRSIRIGRQLRIPRDELQRFLNIA